MRAVAPLLRSTGAPHIRVGRRAQTIAALRLRDLNTIRRARYGTAAVGAPRRYGWKSLYADVMPDADLVRALCRQVALHQNRLLDPERKFRGWVSLHAPWLSGAEISGIIRDVMSVDDNGRFIVPLPTADELGGTLHISIDERDRWGLRTIGAVDDNPQKRKLRGKERHRQRQARRRAAQGAKPRHLSKAKTKPWIAEGMSRSAWYRQRRSVDGLLVGRPILSAASAVREPEHSARLASPVGAGARGAKALALTYRGTVSCVVARSHCARICPSIGGAA